MSDNPAFSQKLLDHPDAKNPKVLGRISIAKRRIQAILDRDFLAHQKTLEQKISEQGPRELRVDPHLVGLAVMDLLQLNRLKKLTHPATANGGWYSNPATSDDILVPRLNELAPLYASVSGDGFGNLTGDALELITFKCLDAVFAENNRYAYQGYFDLAHPKDLHGRYRKVAPPKHIGKFATSKEADFIQFGHVAGPLCIECKNYRQWIYPHEAFLRELIIKAYELNAIPVLIARRLHYTTKTNFLEPAGILAHESYFQYYPADKAELAEKVRHKRSLGFTDVVSTEQPHARTWKFFQTILPNIVGPMAARWIQNRHALLQYAKNEINLAQLYTAIESPAGGKWKEPEDWAEE